MGKKGEDQGGGTWGYVEKKGGERLIFLARVNWQALFFVTEEGELDPQETTGEGEERKGGETGRGKRGLEGNFMGTVSLEKEESSVLRGGKEDA